MLTQCNMEIRGAEIPVHVALYSPSGMNKLSSAQHKSLWRVCNPCDSTALPCWDGNKKLVAKKPGEWFLHCSLRSQGNIVKEASLARLSLECRRPEDERSCQFSLQSVSDSDHAMLCWLRCLVRRSLASSLQHYWMPWKRQTSSGTAVYSALYSTFLIWRITRHFRKQFMGCSKSELLCSRATREPEAGSNACGFGKHLTNQTLIHDFRSYSLGLCGN